MGGVNHLEAFLFLMEQALRSGVIYDYFHLISGQDFYATPPHLFDDLLGLEKKNYMGIFPLPNMHWGWEHGLAIFKYRTLASYGDIRKQPLRFLNSLCKYIQIVTRTWRKLPDSSLYGGPVYSSLTYEFVNWCIESAQAKKLLYRLRNTTCAEEVYFQTLIMNSPFRETVVKDVAFRYVDWKSNPRPKYLDINDYRKIVSSKSLFCRKVDSLRSASLINELERMIQCNL